MVIKIITEAIQKFFSRVFLPPSSPGAQREKTEETHITTVFSLWDYIVFRENSQADHLVRTIGFEEWVDMEEIRRRIRNLFGFEYKNERSLYPYAKTLVDTGFFEATSVGGKRKWRKKPLFFEIKVTQKGETLVAKQKNRAVSEKKG
jgi:hypothetical protein